MSSFNALKSSLPSAPINTLLIFKIMFHSVLSDVSDGNETNELVVARYKIDKNTNKRPNTVHTSYLLFFSNIYQLHTV